MAYSIDLADIYRRVANLIDRILGGPNPGDIPFYQPTKFATPCARRKQGHRAGLSFA
jgi:ABC-type uncharacterized transport system substrate-binding protein